MQLPAILYTTCFTWNSISISLWRDLRHWLGLALIGCRGRHLVEQAEAALNQVFQPLDEARCQGSIDDIMIKTDREAQVCHACSARFLRPRSIWRSMRKWGSSINSTS